MSIAYKKSLADKLSRALSPVMRALSDINLRLMGSRALLIRVDRTDRDSIGDRTRTLTVNAPPLVINAGIKYPFKDIEMFDKFNVAAQRNEMKALDLIDILPFEATIQFSPLKNNDVDMEGTEVKRGDLLVDVLYDHHKQALPIAFEVTRPRGTFFVKNQVQFKVELALLRGKQPPSIQAIIDAHITAMTTEGP